MNDLMLTAAVRLLIVLPLVTALAYFLIKYGLTRKPYIYGGKRRMRVVEQLPLGPKTFLTLTEVGGSYYLLAQHEHGVTVVKEMDGLPGPIDQEEREVKLPPQIQMLTRQIHSLGAKLTKHRPGKNT